MEYLCDGKFENNPSQEEWAGTFHKGVNLCGYNPVLFAYGSRECLN